MKSVNIGLIGFGTVGSGLYYLLEKNGDLIRERTDLDIRLKTICDLRKEAVKKSVSNIYVTDNWQEIVDDEEIDTIVELIGGVEPAKTIILKSLNNRKNVVTANKKLLAEDGKEIFELLNHVPGRLGFEASVAGGIPSIMALRSGLVGIKVHTIMGILNGTTNYILTKMEDDGLSFETALKAAQNKGFAEADPTFDIEGYDAGHKISILSMLACHRRIDYNSIDIEGIVRISELDIIYAAEMGYVIKLLGVAKFIDNCVDIRVHPTMLPLKHPLASVRNEFNAVMYIGDMTGPVILYGKGAGSNPTASAVVSDIVQIAQMGKAEENVVTTTGNACYILPEKRFSRYYMRIHTEDSPGILSKISGVLGKYNISIATVIQKEINSEYVPLIIMTHKAYEKGMFQSIKEINNFAFVDGNVTAIRVEDSLDIGEFDE